ncbi:hypothetical protein HHI36_016241 [Cryptolaemus montrouzieri]|uniref:H15 domain-containing protein n=1 Tax=Cryptolaemus montrouzieri TaxID=559131 RepID=A0ABD2NJ40_9CUCU
MLNRNCSEKPILYQNIFYNVLLVVQILMNKKKDCPEVADIHEYMLRHFSIEGDLYSQILNALERGVKYGFLKKRKNRYCIVCPAATISCKIKPRLFEMERIQSIFDTNCGARRENLCCKRKASRSKSRSRKKRRAHSCGDVKNYANEKVEETSTKTKQYNDQHELDDDKKNSMSLPASKSTFEFYN